MVPPQQAPLSRRQLVLGTVALIPAVAMPVLADDAADEEERIRRKLAAQAKAGNKSDGKKSYSEEFKAEQDKKKAIKQKTKEEKRDDLCELLGRGC